MLAFSKTVRLDYYGSSCLLIVVEDSVMWSHSCLQKRQRKPLILDPRTFDNYTWVLESALGRNDCATASDGRNANHSFARKTQCDVKKQLGEEPDKPQHTHTHTSQRDTKRANECSSKNWFEPVVTYSYTCDPLPSPFASCDSHVPRVTPLRKRHSARADVNGSVPPLCCFLSMA